VRGSTRHGDGRPPVGRRYASGRRVDVRCCAPECFSTCPVPPGQGQPRGNRRIPESPLLSGDDAGPVAVSVTPGPPLCLAAALGALGCGAGLGASAAQGTPQHALGDRSDQRVAANRPQAGSASMFTSVHRTRPFGPHNATPPQRVADSAGAARGRGPCRRDRLCSKAFCGTLPPGLGRR
jgi:hypothetical protein